MSAESGPVGRETTPRIDAPRLRVRTRRDYLVPFLVDHGQRNAVFVKRRWTPLHRFVYWADAFTILPERDFDIVHAINAVPLFTHRPYVLTFEDYLPRVPEDRYVGWLERRLQRELAQPRCVALIAISEYAARQMRRQNRLFDGLGELEAKTEIIRPAVPLRRQRPKRRHKGPLRLLFVGRDFMRKGGPAVIETHERLRAEGIPVATTVVSSLRWSAEDYIGPPSAEVAGREHARVATWGVTHHRSLPNSAITALMEDADFLLFPTVHDTFGFVALEALSCGTPVIATATNALPEVVEDGRNGFLLPIELDPHLGRWAWTYRNREPGYVTAYEQLMADLAVSLTDTLRRCWEQRQDYESLSAGAIETVRERFSVADARDRLEAIYERCRERIPSTITR
jgi:glycosyltransferase involved in cell wall biosynthesis